MTGDTVTVGDHVDVTEFTRRGDDKDIETYDGWVAQVSESRILLAHAPDFTTEPDPWFQSFPLLGPDRVVVTLTRPKPRVDA